MQKIDADTLTGLARTRTGPNSGRPDGFKVSFSMLHGSLKRNFEECIVDRRGDPPSKFENLSSVTDSYRWKCGRKRGRNRQGWKRTRVVISERL